MLEKIVVKPDAELSPYISFDTKSNTLYYNGDSASEILADEQLQVVLTLFDSRGLKTDYTVIIKIEKASQATSGLETTLSEGGLPENSLDAPNR